MKYIVYTDGSCAKNPGGEGGCAALLIGEDGSKRMLTASFRKTTNNRMEVMAYILALKQTNKEDELIIQTDSQYGIGFLQRKYMKMKKNLDLARLLWKEMKDRKVTIDWVKGHNGDKYNEMCDDAAKKASHYKDKEIDKGYEDTLTEKVEPEQIRLFD